MFYELLEFDIVFPFSKNLHPNKCQSLLDDFGANINPKVGYEVIEAPGDDIIPLVPADNQTIVVFDDLVCQKNRTTSSIISPTVGTGTLPRFICRIRTTRCQTTSRTTAAISLYLRFLPRANKRIADELGFDPTCWTVPLAKSNRFCFTTNRTKKIKKKFDECI